MDDIIAPKNQTVSYRTSMPIWWQIWENEGNFRIWKCDRIFIRNLVWAWYGHTRQYQNKRKEKKRNENFYITIHLFHTWIHCGHVWICIILYDNICISHLWICWAWIKYLHIDIRKNKRFNSNMIRCIATTNMRKLLFFFSRKSPKSIGLQDMCWKGFAWE